MEDNFDGESIWPKRQYSLLNFYCMQKLSLKNISVLGVVLMAVSAITAAILPSKKANAEKRFVNGRVIQTAPGINFTCAADASAGAACVTDTASIGGDTVDNGLNGTDTATVNGQTAANATLS
jgi:hypothetical protein